MAATAQGSTQLQKHKDTTQHQHEQHSPSTMAPVCLSACLHVPYVLLPVSMVSVAVCICVCLSAYQPLVWLSACMLAIVFAYARATACVCPCMHFWFAAYGKPMSRNANMHKSLGIHICMVCPVLYKEAMALMKRPMVPPFPIPQGPRSTIRPVRISHHHWLYQVVPR